MKWLSALFIVMLLVFAASGWATSVVYSTSVSSPKPLYEEFATLSDGDIAVAVEVLNPKSTITYVLYLQERIEGVWFTLCSTSMGGGWGFNPLRCEKLGAPAGDYRFAFWPSRSRANVVITLVGELS